MKTLIVAGIHGNETASVLTAREIKGWIEGKGIENVEVIPEVNVRAVSLNRRTDPEDEKDLNRVFPGQAEGSRSERIAWRIFNKAKNFDRVIDLHTYGRNRNCIPYVLTDLEKKENRILAKKIGLDHAVQTSGTRGQLFLELSERGVPSAIIEMGGASKIDTELIERVKDKIIDLLSNDRIKETNFHGNYQKIRKEGKGVFKPKLEPGERVREGDTVGVLDDKSINSPCSGTILGVLSGKYDSDDDYLFSVASN
ncbi:MAG: succinylglutamate desuccinylase/aspartoacylase family protein [Candidatus Aenigmatarchaeota archaeon]